MIRLILKSFLPFKSIEKPCLIALIPFLLSVNLKAETGYVSLNIDVDAVNFNSAFQCQTYMAEFKKKYEVCSQEMVSPQNLVQSAHDEDAMTNAQLAQESELKILQLLDAELLTMPSKINGYAAYAELLSGIIEARISIISQQKLSKKLQEYNFTDYQELITEYHKFTRQEYNQDFALITGYFLAGGQKTLTWLASNEKDLTWLPSLWPYLATESIFNYFVIIKPALFTIPNLIVDQYESHELNTDTSKVGLKYSTSPQDLLLLPVDEACTDLKQSYLLQAATRVAEQFYNYCRDPESLKSVVIPSAYLKH